jgi:ubiquinone/menaquinone biosynthesis C-methylase UbiE
MIERTPEPELMDDAAQAEAYAETDFSEPHDAFVAHFMKRFPGFRTGRVLDLGCGTADVIIRFARAFQEIHIRGIDGARAMLDIGIRDIDRNGLSDRVELERRILPDAAVCARKFDAVISNSLLHHLADPAVIWDMIISCAKEGAPVFVMDLARPESEERAKELLRMHASDAPAILQEDFYNSLLASYTIKEIREQLDTAGLKLDVEAVSDRHLIVWGRKQ